ncbi:hypothetical protein [Rufibacter sp. XAAS-G3-1]|uniref:hypothetical protein n=1 Tax=Rufibacter sp. XAAS-G3-1 TaxID=2729134 RepID=UPI0015E70323|nr:hypothetical protein [Rufibacter sp. XAAS-G3-1]
MNVHSKKNWLLGALLNLLVVALLGVFLRYLMVGTVAGVNYKNLLHAHSHVALLGWLYSAVTVALLLVFLPPELRGKHTYTWQFWLSQGMVLGMLLTFPVQGYAAASITFSTAHILLSYWFIYQFLKDAKAAGVAQGRHRLSFSFVKAALFFLALSSFGPWAMGPIMATGRSGSELYFNAIYFYLHFQYNGWFTFAVLGLFFWLLEHHHLLSSPTKGQTVFRLLFWACLPAFLLSVLWIKPAGWVYWLGGLAALAQVAAVVVLFLLPERKKLFQLFHPWPRLLLKLAAAALGLKALMQMATAFPYLADVAFQLRFFIIGYLHLVLIGCISFFVFAFLGQQGWLTFRGRKSRWGMGIFVLAFFTTEALLFLQGTFLWLQMGDIPEYHALLFTASIFLPLGILLFFLGQFRNKKEASF